jgi:hypothetical protein
MQAGKRVRAAGGSGARGCQAAGRLAHRRQQRILRVAREVAGVREQQVQAVAGFELLADTYEKRTAA